MRIKTYFRLNIDTNQVEELPFDATHFNALGIPSTPVYGMHKLNALELINRWNQASANSPVHKFFYFID